MSRLRAGVERRLRHRQNEPLIVPCEVLRDAFETGVIEVVDGERVPMQANISARHANTLYRTVREHHVTQAIEVGMGHGVSTLSILTALAESEHEASLISIDPSQGRFRDGGLRSVSRAGFDGLHELVRRPDHVALPKLLDRELTVDFAYLDGYHTFDRTLLDFFYVDRMLRPGGVVAFNDCGYPSIHKVTRFVTRHRRYVELDVGLPRTYLTSSPIRSLSNVVARRSKSDRYFVKQEVWEPDSQFWRRF